MAIWDWRVELMGVPKRLLIQWWDAGSKNVGKWGWLWLII